ncbi:MAG TPA: hypothetical protein VGM90_21660 [Kofleriaceae bacterium]|jgi:hypothetical protein
MVVALAVLLACKLAWNVGTPMWLMDKRRGQGISMHLHVELVILVLMIVLADRPLVVALRGLAAIVASYGLAYAVARWLGWRYSKE